MLLFNSKIFEKKKVKGQVKVKFALKSVKDGLYLNHHDSEQEMKMAWDNLEQRGQCYFLKSKIFEKKKKRSKVKLRSSLSQRAWKMDFIRSLSSW